MLDQNRDGDQNVSETPGTSVETAAMDSPRPVINAIECKACGRCVVSCPKQVLAIGESVNARGYHYVEYVGEGCIGCCNCYYTCPEPMALEVHIPQKEK
jgi:NAD-dependent dihydropyrimidine dehydrogenase PreA subunit